MSRSSILCYVRRSAILFSVLALWAMPPEALAKPKYGPEATPLSRSHQYFRQNPAPDYWTISPYYAAQFSESACSIASMSMIVNAARSGQNLDSEEPLANQDKVLDKVKDELWRKAVSKGGHGASLDQLGEYAERSLKAYGFKNASVQVIHAEPGMLGRLRNILTENEKSSADYIIANFLQGTLTGDAEVGHIAPIGAYDAKARRVLIMDPDREWYEPYWVSDEVLLKGMATRDAASGKTRGLVWIRGLRPS